MSVAPDEWVLVAGGQIGFGSLDGFDCDRPTGII